ncbi:MAG: Mrp/NBP35 family ATP-binding protein [Planctomycetaceae bacterium]|nr:Mrp/NBP35 family ATP-binding protein [Planctomycetaceae bacterium]
MNDLELLASLESVKDPCFERTLKDLKMLAGASEQDGRWTIQIQLPTHAYLCKEELTAAIKSAVAAAHPEAGDVDVEYSVKVLGKNAGGSIGLNVKNVIAVGSGKGGVGKSTVAAALAYGLQSFGATVGLMDADVYGPSIPHLVGADGEPEVIEKENPDGQKVQRLQPIMADGMPMMSIGFMIPEDQAVIWRGPMLHKLLTQFMQQTDWGELDYLIIDMPPGTGDVAITLSQMVSLAGAVVVCTPQKVALLDAVKAIGMYKQVKIPVLGIVENMSGDIFGRGGAAKKAEELSLAPLGEIPSDPVIREYGDEGQISRLFSEENPAKEPLEKMCAEVAGQIVLNSLDAPSMPSLEIL